MSWKRHWEGEAECGHPQSWRKHEAGERDNNHIWRGKALLSCGQEFSSKPNFSVVTTRERLWNFIWQATGSLGMLEREREGWGGQRLRHTHDRDWREEMTRHGISRKCARSKYQWGGSMPGGQGSKWPSGTEKKHDWSWGNVHRLHNKCYGRLTSGWYTAGY